jgi:hypothetical protein
MTVTSFEVGAVFRIINEASPQLLRMLKQVNELRAALDKARALLDLLAKPAMGTAIAETDALAASWKNVAKSAAEARAAISGATTASGRAALAGGAGAIVPPLPGGGRRRLAQRVHGGGGGGGLHGYFGGAVPGGHVMYRGGAGSTAALAGLGLLGYGVYQAMEYDDAVAMMATHAGVDLATNRANFRKMLTDAAIATGYDEHAISASAQQELRLFAETGGSNGVDVLPKMLRYAAVEARRKGTPLEESMTSIVGISHMLQKYSEADVDRLAPAFSVLSTRNPMSLERQKTAFGYAVPLLQSLGMDPFDTMAASTALARAGIESTKAGTWIREAAVRAMPGTSLMSKIAFKKHEEALKAFGLVDDHDKPTWFVDGKPNLTKMLDIVSEYAPKIPIEKRAGFERALFGAQGRERSRCSAREPCTSRCIAC